MTNKKESQDFDNVGDYINFWLDNIHCYVGPNTNEKGEEENEYLDPPVIIVATGTDEIQKEYIEVKKDFSGYIDSHVGNQNKRKHILEDHLISNVNINTQAFSNLKTAIFRIAKKSKTWGEILPVRWIILEKQLLEMKSAGEPVVAYNEIAMMGMSHFKENDKLDSFLRYENEVGNIVYFDTLKTHVILDPKWLVNCFKCLVAHEQFQVHVPCTELKQNGKLSNDIIERLFRKVPELKFLENKDFLLQVMDKFDIIVKPILQRTDNEYYMPCMIKKTSFNEMVKNIRDGSDFLITSWFFVEFNFLPPAFFNHILVSHIRKYKLSVDVNNTLALGHGFGIFHIEDSGRERLVLCAAKNCIALQLWYWDGENRDNVLSSCVKMRKQLLGMINNLKMRYRIKLCYNFTLKCSEGNYNNPVGRKSREDMSKTKDYVCGEHKKLHLYSDIFNYWFEMQKEAIDNEDSQRYNQICDLCDERSQYLCVTCNQSMCEDCRTNHQAWEQYSDHDIKQIGIEYKLSYSFPSQGSDISDVKVLPDGLLVIADDVGGQLITCTIKGEQYNRIPVPGRPWSITVVDNNTVAVTLYNDKILTVDIRHRQIINDIYVQGSRCIMYSNNQLFVGCHDNTIKVVSLSGEVIRTMDLGFLPYYICGDDKEHIYISDYNNNKLHCTDNDLNSMFTFTSPDMIRPSGLTIDHEGYILVVCGKSNNVHRISPDGSSSQIIISHIPPSNWSPYICYDSVSQSVIIGRYDTISVYKQK